MRSLLIFVWLGGCGSSSPSVTAEPVSAHPVGTAHQPESAPPEPMVAESDEPQEVEAAEDERRSHPCLEQARAHAATRAREPEGPDDLVLVERGATFIATELPDLDGDGVCDLDLTPSGGAWNKVWPHLLYTSRSCAYAGALVDAELEVTEPGPASTATSRRARPSPARADGSRGIATAGRENATGKLIR